MRRPLLRTALAAALGLALAIAAPLAASAHVNVSPNQADAGTYSQLTFRVPNESDTAGTVRVEVTLPEDTPFASVSYLPVAGWTTTMTTTKLPEPVDVSGNQLTEAVTSVVWAADAGVQIAPGQFQLFTLSLGPVPETGSIPLPAVQTYSDGTVSEWTGEADADKPAPVLYVQDEPAGEHSHSTGGDAAAADEATNGGPADGAATGDAAGDVLARGIAITGLALGGAALVLAAFAFARARSTRTDT